MRAYGSLTPDIALLKYAATACTEPSSFTYCTGSFASTAFPNISHRFHILSSRIIVSRPAMRICAWWVSNGSAVRDIGAARERNSSTVKA